MHGQLETSAGYTIMVADVPSHMEFQAPAGWSRSACPVTTATSCAATSGKLAAAGTTVMPLQKQVWGDEFGMCVDRFGISWLVNISQPQA